MRPMTALALDRPAILAHRVVAGGLAERAPSGRAGLTAAARAGLPDSMPRAALHGLHARVAGTGPDAWEDPALVQVWGPRFSAYVVGRDDVAPFTLGRLPDGAAGRRRAIAAADALERFLDGRRLSYADAGHAMGVDPNSLRYATATGRVRIRWEGARRPIVWTVPAPDIDPAAARAELLRRYLHALGPGTAAGFARWAGVGLAGAAAAFRALARELVPARTMVGDGAILAADEASFRGGAASVGAAGERGPHVRLLPSGDTFVLLHGRDRELVVQDPRLRDLLWTPRVWPGTLLLDGEPAGTWRRAGALLAIAPWREPGPAARTAIEAEAAALPLPGDEGPVRVAWEPVPG